MNIRAVFICLISALSAIAGCGSEDEGAIRVQQVPKRPAPTSAPAAVMSGPVTFAAPDDWIKDKQMPMRYASFHLGEGTNQSDIIVSQLPAGSTASRLANINRWRGQIDLPPLGENDGQASTIATVGGVEGAMFDMTGPAKGELPERRLIVAWIPKGDQWWFFKISGPAKVIAEQEGNFTEFLKSVKFTGETP